ncbi:MAG: hypothetical protein ABSD42_03190 [Candidatus Bathyarchaeia archaeon]
MSDKDSSEISYTFTRKADGLIEYSAAGTLDERYVANYLPVSITSTAPFETPSAVRPKKPSDRLKPIIRVGEIVIFALLFAQLAIFTQLVTVSISYLIALYAIWVIEVSWLIVFIFSDYKSG